MIFYDFFRFFFRWQNIEAKITKVALQKQAVSQMENDMDRWLKEREKLSHKLEKMRLKRRRLHAEKGQASRKLVEDMDDQIENLTSNVNYLQENIVECQQNIMQMENAEEMGKIFKLAIFLGSRSSVNTSSINTVTSVASTTFYGIVVASTLWQKIPNNVNSYLK